MSSIPKLCKNLVIGLPVVTRVLFLRNFGVIATGESFNYVTADHTPRGKPLEDSINCTRATGEKMSREN